MIIHSDKIRAKGGRFNLESRQAGPKVPTVFYLCLGLALFLLLAAVFPARSVTFTEPVLLGLFLISRLR